MDLRRRIVPILLSAVPLVASCIFQNDPILPNNPPRIKSYTPEELTLSFIAPDSVALSLVAEDPDRDRLHYRFVMHDSLLGRSQTVIFRARRGGRFTVQGQAIDGSGATASHSWTIDVTEVNNEPPEIFKVYPDQDHISTAVGSRLTFSVSITDEHPETVEIAFKLTGPQSVEVRGPSRIFEHWFRQNGDYELLATVWDGEYADSVSWDVSVLGYPDTIPPAAILDLVAWTGPEPGTIGLSWTAVGDDGMTGRATGYMVRTSWNPILTEEDWIEASDKQNEPVPAEPGSLETMIVKNLNPGTWLYVAVRAYDEFYSPLDDIGKPSPLGNCVHVFVRGVDVSGKVIDAVTGGPVGNFFVSAGEKVDTTDATGTYFLESIPFYVTKISGRDETVSGDPGDYYDFDINVSAVDTNITMNLYAIPVLPLVNVVEPDVYEGRFLYFMKELADVDGDLGRPTYSRRWKTEPITVYNPPIFWEEYPEIDLQEIARDALSNWETMTEMDLFVETTDSLNADAVIVYLREDPSIAHRVKFEPPTTSGLPPEHVEVRINLNSSGVPMWKLGHMTFAHEFGHVLTLSHSRNIGHLMVGMTLPKQHFVTEDESNGTRVLYRIPNGFDFKQIRED